MRALLACFAFFVIACGGRLETLPDSSSGDTVPCGDAGACPASSEFCSEQWFSPGNVSYTCQPLPASCHSCSCAFAPKANFLCSCIANGDGLTVSCTAQ